MQLSAVTSLTRLMKTASSLPTFTSSHGHTYLPPAPKQAETGQAGMQSQQSKEDTPMPDAVTQTKGPLAGPQNSNTGTMIQDTRTLAESFNLLSRYGDEYMDENPLVGEPGSFILSRSGDADRATASKQAPSTINAANVPTRTATPQVRVDTPGRVSDKGSTPSSSDETKSKKRKSKAAG